MLSDATPSCCVKWAISHHTQKGWQRLRLWTKNSTTKELLPLITKQPGTLHKVEGVSWLQFLMHLSLLESFWSRKLLCHNKLKSKRDEGGNSSKQQSCQSWIWGYWQECSRKQAVNATMPQLRTLCTISKTPGYLHHVGAEYSITSSQQQQSYILFLSPFIYAGLH